MTKIEWTDQTWNPVTGCDKVSQGCKNCYAEVMHRRLLGMFPNKYSQPFLGHVQIHEDELTKPLCWNKPRMIFVNSMSDLFHDDVPFEFIAKVFIAMALCPHHTFQILTKRPERAIQFFKEYEYYGFGDDRTTDELAIDFHPYLYDAKTYQLRDDLKKAGWFWDGYDDDSRLIFENDAPLKNVWLGVSCEDQKTADERIPLLLQVPAVVRFLSCEPLLGAINLRIADNCMDYNCADFGPCKQCIDRDKLHWVIVGGESGHNARPMHPDWVRSIRDQCFAANVPFFFKQWGEFLPLEFDAQPPFRFFSSTRQLIDGHGIDVIDIETGGPGTFKGMRFMDAMDAITFCVGESVSNCDFLHRGKKKFIPKIDGVQHLEFPKQTNPL